MITPSCPPANTEVGLDAQTRNRIWSYVRRLRDERQVTVLVTTHYIEEVEGCDRVCVIDHGKVLALDTPEALKRDHGQQLLRIVPKADDDRREILTRYAERLAGEAGETILLASDDEKLRAYADPAVRQKLHEEMVEGKVEIPGKAMVYDEGLVADFALAAGEPVVFHLHNHGQNTWTLASIQVEVED